LAVRRGIAGSQAIAQTKIKRVYAQLVTQLVNRLLDGGTDLGVAKAAKRPE